MGGEGIDLPQVQKTVKYGMFRYHNVKFRQLYSILTIFG